MSDPNYQVANLSDYELNQIRDLEQKLNNGQNSGTVVIAYSQR
ncbi:hypothetical protein [Desulfosporosinus sp. FKB]|nr:hypothetical protein [Desulfosporosinus sp. FKB]